MIDYYYLNFILSFVLCCIRMSACLVFIPIFSIAGFGVLTRGILFISFSWPIIICYSMDPNLIRLNLFLKLTIALKEFLLGILIGLPLASIWWGVQSAGFIIDQQRAFGPTQSIYNAFSEQSSLLGAAFEIAASAYLLKFDCLQQIIANVNEFFLILGLSENIKNMEIFRHEFIEMMKTILNLIGILATPALISLIIIDVGVFMASRAARNLASDFLILPMKVLTSVSFALLSIEAIFKRGILMQIFHKILSFYTEYQNVLS